MVSRLLDQGAIITDLKSTRRALHSRPIDALTVCILNKEPKTLATILRHPNLDMVESSQNSLLLGHQEFSEIVEEMLSPKHLNAVIVESFFTNISDFRLRNMEEKTLVNLVKKSLEYAPEAAADDQLTKKESVCLKLEPLHHLIMAQMLLSK